MNLAHTGAKDHRLDAVAVEDIGVTAATTVQYFQSTIEPYSSLLGQLYDGRIGSYCHAGIVADYLPVDGHFNPLPVDNTRSFLGRFFQASNHMFGLHRQLGFIVAARLPFQYHLTGNNVYGLAAIKGTDIGGGLVIDAPQTHGGHPFCRSDDG